MVTLYNVISSDGYIARKDGSEDFIPDSLWQNFLDLCGSYDTLVMGRKTYDTIQQYDRVLLELFEKLAIKKIVVTKNRKFYPKEGYIVAHSLIDAPSLGINTLVSSGPILNTELLEKNMVDQVIFHVVPTSIGEGIKPFNIETRALLMPVPNPKSVKGVEVREYRVTYN